MSVVSPGGSSNMSSVGAGSGSSASSSESSSHKQQQQQQHYEINGQQVEYHEEFNRMRERLFRILSKVPIQVETTTSCPNQMSPEEAKSSSCQRTKVSDREPITIKYYNQKSLAEILELHFSCSLIKHNLGLGLPGHCSEQPASTPAYIDHQPAPGSGFSSQSSWAATSYPAQNFSDTHLQAPSGGHQQPVPANPMSQHQYPVGPIYQPQAHNQHHLLETGGEVLPAGRQPWQSQGDTQTAKIGGYKGRNDGCAVELVDGQRHPSPASGGGGGAASLGTQHSATPHSLGAQEGDFHKVACASQFLSAGYYVVNNGQLVTCSAPAATELACGGGGSAPISDQQVVDRNQQVNSFASNHHCPFLQVPAGSRLADELAGHPEPAALQHHEPATFYYQSKYPAFSSPSQHPNQQHQQQHWQPSADSQHQLQQAPTEAPNSTHKLLMIEGDHSQLKAADQYQHLTGYTASAPGCCAFIYGSGEQPMTVSGQVYHLPAPMGHLDHQAPAAPGTGHHQLSTWALQN